MKDRSGSCAIILLITEVTVYVANVVDSRAIISSEFGTKAESISNDHKPSELSEQTRIIAGGGRVY